MRSDLQDWRDPAALIEPHTLEANLSDPALRIVDLHHLAHSGRARRRSALPGRARNRRVPGGTHPRSGVPRHSGRNLGFRHAAPLHGAPSEQQFAEAMGRLGIENESRVVLYSNGSIMWATRVWWMLRGFGFDGAAVLDGGLRQVEVGGTPGVRRRRRLSARPVPMPERNPVFLWGPRPCIGPTGR